MSSGKTTLRLTRHAHTKIAQRDISVESIRAVVSAPECEQTDKLDSSLTHFIGKVGERPLRVIGRWESKDVLLVVSAFYDRRLRRREEDDKDQL